MISDLTSALQVLLPLLHSDLYQVFINTLNGKLACNAPVWQQDGSAVTVVLASAGYPGSYRKGVEVSGAAGALRLHQVCLWVSHGASVPQVCLWFRTWGCRFSTPALL